MARWSTDLHLSERRVLHLLRSTPGAVENGEDPALRADFDGLRDALTALPATTILPTDDRWVSPDELLLLTWLATLQRRNRALPSTLPSTVSAALDRCAAGLDRMAISLPHRTMARVARLSKPVEPCAPAGEVRQTVPAPRMSRSVDVRERALSMLRDRCVLSSSDFVASGIPLQMVNSLHRQGLIDRVHAGWFRSSKKLFQEAAA